MFLKASASARVDTQTCCCVLCRTADELEVAAVAWAQELPYVSVHHVRRQLSEDVWQTQAVLRLLPHCIVWRFKMTPRSMKHLQCNLDQPSVASVSVVCYVLAPC